MKFDIGIFLKGMLMGVCDLIPGISGGTVAFITGIYERLINSVKGVLSFGAIVNFFVLTFYALFVPKKKNFKKFDKFCCEHDLYFLFTLLFGILIAILIGSRVVHFLLLEYFVITMFFFIGLVVASSFLIYGKIDDHNVVHRLLGVVGFLLGVALLFLVSASVEIGLFYVFLSGFVGISAMFLPGISGSYILLVMGSYEYILEAIGNFDFTVIFIFGFGLMVGAALVSRFISFMLKKYHSSTLYFLFGFVLGALFVPLCNIYEVVVKEFVYFDLIFGGVMFLIGVVLVVWVGRVVGKK